MKNVQRVADSNFDRIQARNGLTAKNQSQMTKLLPMLELAAKKEVPAELVQQRMENRGKALTDVLAAVDKTIKSMATVAKVDHPTQMKKLTLGIKRLKTIVSDKPPQGTPKFLKAAMNEMVSIREGVFTSAAMTAEDYSTPLLTKAREGLIDLMASNDNQLKKHHAQQSGIDEQVEEEERMYSDFASILKSAKEDATKAHMEEIRNKPWVVIRAPVIPMPNKGILDPQKFKRAGFKCESMAGYPMFRSQLVIGINKTMLDVTDKEKAKGSAIPTERVFKAAAKVKRVVEKQTGTKLHFVEERPHGAAGGSWFWLMSERDINAFKACCPGDRIQLLNFGFAF